MNRRDFLKGILTASAAVYTIDIDKLLWVPGEKKIFIPNRNEIKTFSKNYISESDIIAAELARISWMLPTLFERDDKFFNSIVMVSKAGELMDTELNKKDRNHPIIISPYSYKDEIN